jgi:aromatic ring-opening dioxygenase catalytic subunit (LigB family)
MIMASRRLPTYFLTHGGGPWPWMKDEFGANFKKLEASLLDVRREIGDSPRAALLVSGHWLADRFLVASGERPPMVYDYSGFPEFTYRIRYDAPGDPAVAELVRAMLEEGGVPSGLDPRQGFDHGAFTLMKPMYPEATMPIVLLSLRADCDAAIHLKVGELLAPLRDQGVLIIGSGASFHDPRGMVNGSGAKASAEFDGWLAETLLNSAVEERRRRLVNWTAAPSGRASHPHPDHLLPLMVAVGAAGADAAHRVFQQDDFMGAISLSSYRFGDPVLPTNAREIEWSHA